MDPNVIITEQRFGSSGPFTEHAVAKHCLSVVDRHW